MSEIELPEVELLHELDHIANDWEYGLPTRSCRFALRCRHPRRDEQGGMEMSEQMQNEHSALMELCRATNLLLNEASGVAEGGVTPATFDRAKRAYDSAIRVLNDPMRKLRESLCKTRQ